MAEPPPPWNFNPVDQALRFTGWITEVRIWENIEKAPRQHLKIATTTRIWLFRLRKFNPPWLSWRIRMCKQMKKKLDSATASKKSSLRSSTKSLKWRKSQCRTVRMTTWRFTSKPSSKCSSWCRIRRRRRSCTVSSKMDSRSASGRGRSRGT